MLVSVKNLSKTYTTKTFFGKKKFLALDNINFSLAENESISLIGKSGSGKTTFARILARLIDFDCGEVSVLDKDINSYECKDFSNIIQMIFQNPYASLNPKLRIKSSLKEAMPKSADISFCYKVLESMGLEPKILNNFPHQFSGGQRQRIAIARALLKKPKLIIADEPFASLDTFSKAQIMSIFKDIKKGGASIILITHDKDAAKEFSEKIISIEDGKIGKADL
jgi:ABC-type dipeptide/oligopeptide/nickel transport system ATPase subunit